MKLVKLPDNPPGSNPFHHDLSRMGVRLGSDLMAMMMNHDTEPSRDLVLVNTVTGERFAVDTSVKEPVRIKMKSMGEVPDGEGLFGLKYMEGGSYIHDWLHKLSTLAYSSVVVTDKVAECILLDAGLDPQRYGNKDFFRFTQEGEVSGFNEEPIISFLYRHDFRWYVYTLR